MDAFPLDVAEFLGRGSDPKVLALAEAHLPLVYAFVRAYTRGGGFSDDVGPGDDVRAVIITACARLVTNPEQVSAYTIGDVSERPAVLNGFTLPELAVLHRYRRRAL